MPRAQFGRCGRPLSERSCSRNRSIRKAGYALGGARGSNKALDGISGRRSLARSVCLRLAAFFVNSVDYAILAIYLLAVLWAGGRFGSDQRSLKAFFLGGRSIPWWAAACSGIATMVSAIGYLGAPGQAFGSDWTYLQARLAWPVAIVATCVLFIPIFYKLKVFTAYEYLEKRFDLKTRVLASTLFVVLKCFYTAVAIYAPSLVVAEMTGLPLAGICLGIGALTTLYTTVGGMRAVIWTDTLQFVVLLAGLVIACVTAVGHVDGGLREIFLVAHAEGKLRFLDWSMSLETDFTVWSGLIGGTFFLLSQYAVDQAELQRFLTTASVRDSTRALVSTMVFTSIYGLIVFFIGTALYVLYSQHPGHAAMTMDPDRVFPMFILERIPTGFRSLLIAGVFAASMSTVSSILNSLATVAVRDVIEPLLKIKGSVRMARRATVIFGCVTTIISLYARSFGTILVAQGKIRNFFGGSLVGVFLLGLLCPRVNGSAAFWSMVSSFLATALLAFATDVSWMWYSAFATLVAFITGLGLSRVSEHPDEADLVGLVWRKRNV